MNHYRNTATTLLALILPILMGGVLKNKPSDFHNIKQELVETWQIHNRINSYLLDAIDKEYMADKSASGGRTIGEQFAHVHNVRIQWLNSVAPGSANKLNEIDPEQASEPSLLKLSIEESGKIIAHLIENGFEGANQGQYAFKPHATAFIGYLISHESHHRGQIILSLKQSGHMIPDEIAYGLWDWSKR